MNKIRSRQELEQEYLLYREKARRLARHSFLDFVLYTTPGYKLNWHHRKICEALDKIIEGKIKRLLIKIAPRHGKSLLASERFPSYYLGRFPKRQLIAASHGEKLVNQFGRSTRNLMNSADYLDLFPDSKLSPDSQAKNLFSTAVGGKYLSVGVTSSVHGFGSHLAIVDDTIGNRRDAYSDILKEDVWSWYNTDIISRRMNPNAEIVIGTPFSVDDILGRIKALPDFEKDWVEITFPVLDDDNNALWPEMYPLEYLMEIKKRMAPMDWQSLYMINPMKPEGNFFKLKWFQGYQRDDIPAFSTLRFYITLDAAFSEDGGDFTSILVWAIDPYGYIMLVDEYNEQVTNLVWGDKLLELVKKFNPFSVFTEKGQGFRASEPIIRQKMKEQNTYFRLVPVPITKSKEQRAASLQALIENGIIYFPKYRNWYNDFESEFLQFPNGKHDDRVDSASLIGMFINGLIEGEAPPKLEDLSVAQQFKKDFGEDI